MDWISILQKALNYIEDYLLDDIDAEIIAKNVLLTFRIVRPPVCSIICGYADDGDILIGCSQFTGEIKENEIIDQTVSKNYFQVKNGLDNSEALIFFGKKKDRLILVRTEDYLYSRKINDGKQS